MTEPVRPDPARARSSRQRYKQFRQDYRTGRLDDPDDFGSRLPRATPDNPDTPESPKRKALLSGERRAYLRD